MPIFIQAVKAREIFDSRGNPNVEVNIALTDGTLGKLLFHQVTLLENENPLNSVMVVQDFKEKEF